MHFELWDTESRNLLYDFDGLDEAVAAASELTVLNTERYPERLALGRVNDDSTTTWIAAGSALTPLMADRKRRTA
jgi:hypothetical protein